VVYKTFRNSGDAPGSRRAANPGAANPRPDAPQLPFPDALQEFQVATSGLSAESGVKSGASVNAVTKSGTNRFSGNGFEFLRDYRFNAPERFAPFSPDGKQLVQCSGRGGL